MVAGHFRPRHLGNSGLRDALSSGVQATFTLDILGLIALIGLIGLLWPRLASLGPRGHQETTQDETPVLGKVPGPRTHFHKGLLSLMPLLPPSAAHPHYRSFFHRAGSRV